MSVKDGRIVLPSGMSYRVLALPDRKTMTPAVLRKLSQLVKAGATVVGPKPDHSPSLTGYPACDAEVKKLADELWPNGVLPKSPTAALASLNVPPDFTCQPKARTSFTFIGWCRARRLFPLEPEARERRSRMQFSHKRQDTRPLASRRRPDRKGPDLYGERGTNHAAVALRPRRFRVRRVPPTRRRRRPCRGHSPHVGRRRTGGEEADRAGNDPQGRIRRQFHEETPTCTTSPPR